LVATGTEYSTLPSAFNLSSNFTIAFVNRKGKLNMISPIHRKNRSRLRVVFSLSVDCETTKMIAEDPKREIAAEVVVRVEKS
jgi:hypothetical protein